MPSPTSVSQQPTEPQRHGWPSGLTVMCPISPANPATPVSEAAVDDHAAADADLARDVQHVVDADGRAAPGLAQDARVGVVEHGDRDRGRERPREARRRAARRPSRGWGPSTRGRRCAGRRRRPPPRCRRSASRRAPRSSPARAARSATTSSTDSSHPRPVDARTARASRRRGPTIATAIESTRISRLSTTAPCGLRRTSGEGRPGVPRGTGRSSVTSPAAASSPTSARIALRVRPVAATSSERESGPRSWRPRTIALRFARWTVSLRCPTSTRSTRKVCDPFLQTCARLIHRRARVKSAHRIGWAREDGRGALGRRRRRRTRRAGCAGGSCRRRTSPPRR